MFESRIATWNERELGPHGSFKARKDLIAAVPEW